MAAPEYTKSGRKGEGVTRKERGIRLFRERGGEIEHAGGSLWLVPSSSREYAYVVDLKAEKCDCPDHQHQGVCCMHIVAAQIVRAKTAECESCRQRRPWREIFEVGDDHLTFFKGDRVCEKCAITHGVL